jgi:mediator of RNA polymerase II transcription subunit 14
VVDGGFGMGMDDPGGEESPGRRFSGEERQGILDLVNEDVLAPRVVETGKLIDILVDNAITASEIVKPESTLGRSTAGDTPSRVLPNDQDASHQAVREGFVDAPLVRLYNFIRMSSRSSTIGVRKADHRLKEHLSLSYQLELLFSQAMALSQERWRGQLAVEIDRSAKVLRARYWV